MSTEWVMTCEPPVLWYECWDTKWFRWISVWTSDQGKTETKMRLTGLFLVFTAAGISGSRCQEHNVCLGLEKRTSPRYSDWTLRQSITLHSFPIKKRKKRWTINIKQSDGLWIRTVFILYYSTLLLYYFTMMTLYGDNKEILPTLILT